MWVHKFLYVLVWLIAVPLQFLLLKWMGNAHWVLGRAGTELGGRVRRAELGVGR